MNDAAQSLPTDITPEQGELKSSAMMSLIGAAHAVEDQIENALSTHGLSMAKLGVLTKLVEAGGPLTLGEIAAQLRCVRSNITQLVDRLETDELVRRIDDASDRRSIRAELTQEGRTRQAAGTQSLEEVQAGFLKSLGNSLEQSILVQLLNRVG